MRLPVFVAVTEENVEAYNEDLETTGYMDWPAEPGDIIGYLDTSCNGAQESWGPDEAFGPGWLIEDDLEAFGCTMEYTWFETADLAEKEFRRIRNEPER